jgi:proteasome lid subunit RPN8/RPN11
MFPFWFVFGALLLPFWSFRSQARPFIGELDLYTQGPYAMGAQVGFNPSARQMRCLIKFSAVHWWIASCTFLHIYEIYFERWKIEFHSTCLNGHLKQLRSLIKFSDVHWWIVMSTFLHIHDIHFERLKLDFILTYLTGHSQFTQRFTT